jgi:hypothetical protein
MIISAVFSGDDHFLAHGESEVMIVVVAGKDKTERMRISWGQKLLKGIN